MNEIILLKYGEIALKGQNKAVFEQVLLKGVKHRCRMEGDFEITKAQSTVYVTPLNDQIDMDSTYERLSKVFGISTITRAMVAKKNEEDMGRVVVDYLKDKLVGVSTFKVESKRSDKSFPMTSLQLSAKMGEYVLNAYPHLRVDLHQPDLVIWVEVREKGAYIHAKAEKAAGGMPVGTSGKGALLLSGGIDSPVAGYMMARRGVKLIMVHFFSPPYTSERAKGKVEKLAQLLTGYTGTTELYVVPFTKIQEQIRQHCNEEYFTLIMRRLMMMIASKIAVQNGCECLITGESLAQVASQTMKAIGCTDVCANMPVFRPCIGMDKSDIIEISRKIDTFDTSILPYEDCCTVFTPKHPKTRPELAAVMAEEAKLPVEELVDEAVKNTQKQVVVYQ